MRVMKRLDTYTIRTLIDPTLAKVTSNLLDLARGYPLSWHYFVGERVVVPYVRFSLEFLRDVLLVIKDLSFGQSIASISAYL